MLAGPGPPRHAIAPRCRERPALCRQRSEKTFDGGAAPPAHRDRDLADEQLDATRVIAPNCTNASERDDVRAVHACEHGRIERLVEPIERHPDEVSLSPRVDGRID